MGKDMADNDQMNDMLTVREVARLLHVHPNTLRRWTNNGRLKAYRIPPRGVCSGGRQPPRNDGRGVKKLSNSPPHAIFPNGEVASSGEPGFSLAVDSRPAMPFTLNWSLEAGDW